MLAQLHFPSIVRLYGVAMDGPVAYVVTEFVPLTLADAPMREDFTTATFVSVVSQTLGGIAYIHGREICHRDIKPQNILLTPDYDVKICDLGMARFGGASNGMDRTMTVGTGTPVYMPPEVLLEGQGDAFQKGRYNAYAWDVYSLGMVLWGVWYKTPPFGDKSLAKIIYEVCYNHARPSFEMEGSIEGPPPLLFQRLCSDMWAEDPDDRPDIQGACARFEKEVKPDLLETRVSEAFRRFSTITEDGGSGLKHNKSGGGGSMGGSGLKGPGGGSGIRKSAVGSLSSQ